MSHDGLKTNLVTDGGPTLKQHWVDVSCLPDRCVAAHGKAIKHFTINMSIGLIGNKA